MRYSSHPHVSRTKRYRISNFLVRSTVCCKVINIICLIETVTVKFKCVHYALCLFLQFLALVNHFHGILLRKTIVPCIRVLRSVPFYVRLLSFMQVSVEWNVNIFKTVSLVYRMSRSV